MSKKAIFTAAITGGIHTPTMTPYLPITPKQIADETVRAWEAGASVAHIHVRNPETGQPSSSLELYREAITDIKSRCDIVLCITTGGGLGMPTDQRLAVIPAFEPELGSFNFGSINVALFPLLSKHDNFKFPWEPAYLSMTEDYIFPNTFKSLREFAASFKKYGTTPEIEIYDVAMINNLAYMIEAGHIQKPVYLQFVMGLLGGIPATIENLVFLYKTAKETIGDFVWSVCAAGKNQIKMGTAALLLDGNVRVGMEDSLYAGKGHLAKSNAEQVEGIVKIAGLLGIEPATPAETRMILGLKGLDRVKY
jgi:uncharacterized protein (DUF849 family)